MRWHASDGEALCGWSLESPSARFNLVILHGLGEHSGRYTWLGEQMIAATGNVFAMDMRGHGKSSGKRGHSRSFKQLCNDLDLPLKQAMQNGLPTFLFGHSLGGAVALSYAINHSSATSLAGVIAASPLLRLNFAPPPWKLFLARKLAQQWPTFSLNRGIKHENLSRDPAIIAAYKADNLNHEMVSASLTSAFLAAGEQTLANAEQLSVPALILHGKQDLVTLYSASKEFATNSQSQFKGYPECRHELVNEPEKAQVVGDICNFIEQQLAARLASPTKRE